MPRETVIQLLAWVVPLVAGSSWLLSFATSWLAKKSGAIDIPSSQRKIHDRPIPLFGGLGIGVLVIAGLLWSMTIATSSSDQIRLMGIAMAILLLLCRGMLDELFSLPPYIQLILSAFAISVAFSSGLRIEHLTNPLTGTLYSLQWWQFWKLSLPADLLTIAWLFLATYAMKLLDGLDGLVSGLTVIGAGLIASFALSSSYYQPMIAILASVIAGSYVGFLPRNWNGAKQFLGESGSTIAGFSLGALSILSSSKIAISLAVLAIPIADMVFVVIGRWSRGAKWYEGDATHLHHQLLRLGWSRKTVVWAYWLASAMVGASVLFLQTRGKLFVFALVMVAVGVVSIALQRRTSRG